MIRAAAKNYQDVAVVVSPADYSGRTGGTVRERAASCRSKPAGGWRRRPSARPPITTPPSALGWNWKAPPAGALPLDLNLRAPKAMDLRYGENPHQAAALYARRGQGVAGAEQLHGKELSYNNLVDLDAAYQLAAEFDAPAVAIIKHTNPCGCAEQRTLAEAWRKALRMRSGVGIRRQWPASTERWMKKPRAKWPSCSSRLLRRPTYSTAALAILTAKKNLRLMRVEPGPAGGADPLVVKSISGGYLVQTADTARLDRALAAVASKRAPTTKNGRPWSSAGRWPST